MFHRFTLELGSDVIPFFIEPHLGSSIGSHRVRHLWQTSNLARVHRILLMSGSWKTVSTSPDQFGPVWPGRVTTGWVSPPWVSRTNRFLWVILRVRIWVSWRVSRWVPDRISTWREGPTSEGRRRFVLFLADVQWMCDCRLDKWSLHMADEKNLFQWLDLLGSPLPLLGFHKVIYWQGSAFLAAGPACWNSLVLPFKWPCLYLWGFSGFKPLPKWIRSCF